MSERDEATGQFTPSEPHVLDFVPRPEQKHDQQEYGSDNQSLRAAADDLANSRGASGQETVELTLIDEDGNPAPKNESVTLKQAVGDLSNYHEATRAALEAKTDADVAAAVDAARAEALKANPDAAEIYGFELPKETASEPEAVLGKNAAAEEQFSSGELDAQIEAALNHPQIKAALESQVIDNHRAQQQHIEGLKAATEFAALSFADQFPEFATIPQEQWQNAFAILQQQNPARAQQAANYIARAYQLAAQRDKLNAEQEQRKQQQFSDYAKEQDAIFSKAVAKVEPEVLAEIAESLKENGIDPAEFDRLIKSDRMMRSAFAQKTMWEAAKYRLLMKAAPKAVSKPLPPVNRPGAARSQGEIAHAGLDALKGKFERTGNIKDAVALLQAQRSARR